MCDEGETADRADAVRTESQKMESRAGETALDGSARSIIVLIVVGMLVGVLFNFNNSVFSRFIFTYCFTLLLAIFFS